MSKCIDQRFADMLGPYQFGMLDGPATRELEQHLLECAHCLNEVKEFSRAGQLIRHDPEIRRTMEALGDEDVGGREAMPERSRPQILRRAPRLKIVPIFVAAAAVLVLLLLKPWDIEIRPSKEAVAVENRLAVMYFDNLVDPNDPKRLGEVAANLLITDLTESRYLQVVSSQRLYDILKLIGREGQKRVDKDVASQVAREAGAEWLLMASIVAVEPQLVLTGQIIEVASGVAIASHRIEGVEGDDLFSLVDRLSADIKYNLSLPDAARREPDRPIADVTTSSLEAYRYYVIALDYASKHYTRETREYLGKALEIDSTFAMAHYEMARTFLDASGATARRIIRKAVEYSDNVTLKERLYITSMDAYAREDMPHAIAGFLALKDRFPDEKEAIYQLGVCYYTTGRFEEAVQQFAEAFALDSLDKPACNDLAHAYSEAGDLSQAISTIDKCVSLAPDEASPLNAKGDIYASHGRLREAIECYRRAGQIDPSWLQSLQAMGYAYLFLREYASAESCFTALANSSNECDRAEGRTRLALIPLHQGKFDQALQELTAITTDPPDNWCDSLWDVYAYSFKAGIHEELGNSEAALSEYDAKRSLFRSLIPHDTTYMLIDHIRLLSENGELVRAEKLMETVQALNDSADQQSVRRYWYASGCIHFGKREYDAAVECLTKAAAVAMQTWKSSGFKVRVMLGRAYLELNRPQDAVTAFEPLALSYCTEARLWWPLWSVKLHYWLGLAYEGAGRTDDAIAQYEQFLGYWGDGDSDIEAVAVARERRKKLRTAS